MTGRVPAPVRLLHLGLGSFFRAHQVWYTQRASAGDDWGIAAFTGRDSGGLVQRLNAQDGLYTLIVREEGGDRFEVMSALSRAHGAAANDEWLAYFRSPALAGVTLTVTEAGYMRGRGGGLDVDDPAVHTDICALKRDMTAPAVSAPGRLVAGFAARRRSGAGPIALIPCDNLQDNGVVAASVVLDLAERVEAGLVPWISDSVSVVTTVVDRITPRTRPEDVEAVARATGFEDSCPVVTEPFHEWVLSGAFPAGRPRWEHAGATFADDATPYERRKLWLLNGAHSLLAYAGSALGHETVADAVDNNECRAWVEQWWAEASPHVGQPAREIEAYRDALLERFGNPRILHRLAQIAADGSQKLPVRILPVIRAERAAGRIPVAGLRALAAWIRHLRGVGAPVDDVAAERVVGLAAGPLPDAVRAVLAVLDPELADDQPAVGAVVELCDELTRMRRA